jgi:plasmid stabilization system protein ParE
MYEVIMKPLAINMVKEAYEWYKEQQKGLGDRFLQELRASSAKLESWPDAYTKIKKNYRQLVLHTFPYVIVFEIIKNEVIVYAVFHTSRNPAKKFRKK